MRTAVALRISAWAALWVFGAAGCYNPDLGPGRFACAQSTECPEGQVCVLGRCALAGSGPTDASIDAVEPRRDLGRPADMATPQPMPDLANPSPTPVAGCAQAGYALSNDVFACPGAFEPGPSKARALCKAGFHLCGDVTADGARLSGARACPAGFYALSTVAYAGRVTGGGPPRNVLSCQPSNDLKPALAGCGTESAAVIAQADDARCNGSAFPAIIRSSLVCEAQAKDGSASWTCQDLLESATHKPRDATLGGVLCCRD